MREGFKDFCIIRIPDIKIYGQKIFDLKKDEKYHVPYLLLCDTQPTHIRVGSRGKLSFGISKHEKGDKVTKNGLFFKIPPRARAVSFPQYEIIKENHMYGSPKWHFTL